MASTPTLPSSGWVLELAGRDGTSSVVRSSLRSGRSQDPGIDICEEGCVEEAGRYDLLLTGPQTREMASAAFTVDGDEVAAWPLMPATEEGAAFRLPDDALVMACGLVRFGVTIKLRDGRLLELASLDVPCLSRDPRQGELAAAIVQLFAGEQADNQVLSWMFALATSQEQQLGWSLVERAGSGGGAWTVTHGLDGVQAALDVFAASAGAVHAQAATDVSWTARRVPAREVRRAGSFETQWLARHPEVLVEDPHGLVTAAGKRFSPKTLMVSVPERSAATYENGVLLGFLATTVAHMGSLAQTFAERAEAAEKLKGQLAARVPQRCGLPALAVASIAASRLRTIANRARTLHRSAVRLRSMYESYMPGVVASTNRRRPRRTKTFRDNPLYAKLWHAMERVWEHDCPDEGRDSLALQSPRLDALYEYYVLYRLLEWCARNGFGLQPASRRPLEHLEFTCPDARWHSQDVVTSVYRLERGATRITLYYQPVLSGADAPNEHGVTLRRTTRPRYSDGSVQPFDSFFTPDYLLVVNDPEGRRNYLLDAKAASLRSLVRSDDAADTARGWVGSVFQKMLEKYLLQVADEHTGRPADGMWLLNAQSDGEPLWVYQTSGWMRRSWGNGRRSGVAEVSPLRPGSLDGLFAELGIAAEEVEEEELVEDEVPAEEEATGTEAEAEAADAAGQIEEPAEEAQDEAGEAEGPVGAAEEPEAENEPGPTAETEARAEEEPAASKPEEAATKAGEPVESEPEDKSNTGEVTATAEPAVLEAETEPETEPPAPPAPKQPSVPKQPKKKKEKKPRPAKPARAVGAESASFTQICELLATLDHPLYFSSPSFCQRTINLNVALVKQQLDSKDTKAYDPATIGDRELFVYKRVTPVHVNTLKRYAAAEAAEKEANATSENDPINEPSEPDSAETAPQTQEPEIVDDRYSKSMFTRFRKLFHIKRR